MQKLVNFLRGSVRLTVTGPFPERFLNLCAQEGIPFWGLERLSREVFALTVSRWARKRACALGEKLGYGVEVGAGRGLPAFARRFSRRYAFLVGLGLSLAAVCLLSRVILTVEISGNTTVPSARIAAALRLSGVYPGAYGPGIDPALAGQQVLQQVDGLSWCAVNLKGTVAQVLVREAVKPPQLLDRSLTGDVVAKVPGLITHIEVLEGEAVVAEGITVAQGDVLITGNIHMEGAQYSGIDLGWRQEQAQGRVYARTWRTLEAQIPLEARVKCYTGEVRDLWSLQIFGNRINFYTNSGFPFPMYDKISQSCTAALPGGQVLPLTLTRETARSFSTRTAAINTRRAQSMLEERLYRALLAAVGEGEVVEHSYTCRQADGMLIVTLQSECLEEIGTFLPHGEEP